MTNLALPKLNFRLSTLIFAAGFLALEVPPSSAQAGGATIPASSELARAPYVATMTFDVASVRENREAEMTRSWSMSAPFVQNSTTLRAINWTIESLIQTAYGVDRFQVVGYPEWPIPTLFVIEAKGDSDADAKMATLTDEQQWAEHRHMMQALLEDRFKLKTHWETREGDIYNLVVAKSGPKLGAQGSMPWPADELKRYGNHPPPSIYQKNDGQAYDFIAHGASIGDLVKTLTGQFGRPVIDKTSLTGKFDFVLKYKGSRDRDRPVDDLDPTPPLDQGLQNELGLKVEPAKGPMKALVIDHIEKPSEN